MNTEIIMESKVYRVDEIKKKTSALYFSELKIGDTIKFSIQLKASGRAGGSSPGGVAASYVTVDFITLEKVRGLTFNEVDARLKYFVLSESKH